MRAGAGQTRQNRPEQHLFLEEVLECDAVYGGVPGVRFEKQKKIEKGAKEITL